MSDTASRDPSRREFIGGAALTTAGVATGLSYMLSKDNIPAPGYAEPVKLGFIGVGSRGGALLRAALRVPGAQVVHICDKRESMLVAKQDRILKWSQASWNRNHAAREWAEEQTKAGIDQKDWIKKSVDYKEVLSDPDVDAVVIATPLYLHGPMAIAALEAGKHVYCEKAMAYSIGESKDIYRLATERKDSQVFQVGHQRHYSKMYKKVKELVRGGRIGNVTALRAQWNRNDEIRRPCEDPRLEKLINWRLYREFSGGLMSEFATHQVDVFSMLLDAHPTSVCGMGGQDYPRYKDDRDTSDNVHVVYTFMPRWRELAEVKKDGELVDYRFEPTDKRYPVRFSYMSIMTNSLLGPSELVMGDEGSIEVTLAGGDFWKEAKVLRRRDKIAQGTDPTDVYQKRITGAGGTIAAVKKGRPDADVALEIPYDEKFKKDWSEFTGKVPGVGGHSPQETLLALDSFLTNIRHQRGDTKPTQAVDAAEGEAEAETKVEPPRVLANVKYGLWAAVAAEMANIAMEENRVVHWDEFFPPEEGWDESFETNYPDPDPV
jgi:predicted dehydrogenase